MKFYNPFKAHIVEFADGTFAVRKRGWCGLIWVYKDSHGWRYSENSEIQWWSATYLRHCKVETYETALRVLVLRKPSGQHPNKVVQVHHG